MVSADPLPVTRVPAHPCPGQPSRGQQPVSRTSVGWIDAVHRKLKRNDSSDRGSGDVSGWISRVRGDRVSTMSQFNRDSRCHGGFANTTLAHRHHDPAPCGFNRGDQRGQLRKSPDCVRSALPRSKSPPRTKPAAENRCQNSKSTPIGAYGSSGISLRGSFAKSGGIALSASFPRCSRASAAGSGPDRVL